jgi:hypothetical protein
LATRHNAKGKQMPKVDMTGASDGFEPVPRGTYRVFVSDAEDKTVASGDNAGKPFSRWTFTIADGQYEGRKIFTNMMHWGGGRFLLKQLLVSSGLKTKEEAESPDLEFDYEDLYGEQVCVRVTVKPETDEFQASNEVKKIMSPDEPTSEETAPEGEGSLMPS